MAIYDTNLLYLTRMQQIIFPLHVPTVCLYLIDERPIDHFKGSLNYLLALRS